MIEWYNYNVNERATKTQIKKTKEKEKMNEIYCKAGRVELTKKEAFDIYEQKKYIATSTAIYQPHYSQAQKAVYFTQISTIKGIAKRGHFYKLTAQEINHILGYEYLAV